MPLRKGMPSLEAAQTTASNDPSAIGLRLDRLPFTGLHFAVLALCTLGLSADIGEVALSNTFSVLFMTAPYNASRYDVSLLLAAVFAGGAIGAPAFGWWADHRGRRVALQIALALLAASSLAAAWSPTIKLLTVLRFVSGLALGAYPPLTAAYLSDLLPPLRRGVLMMQCAAFAFLGAPLMIFLIRWLTPLAPLSLEGWRWALIVGAAISASTAGLFFCIPESPRWLAALGRAGEAESSCRRFEAAGRRLHPASSEPSAQIAPQATSAPSGSDSLSPAPRPMRRFVLLGLLYGLGPWATIGFPLLSASVMMQKGFRVGESLLFAAVTMFGPTLGIFVAAIFIDRIERRVALVLCATAMAAVGLAFAIGTALTPLIALGTVFSLATAVYSAVLSVYGAELFPTRLRATATASAWAVGRTVSAFVPITLLPLLGTYGVLAMFGVIATTLLLSAALIVTGPPGLARRPVE